MRDQRDRESKTYGGDGRVRPNRPNRFDFDPLTKSRVLHVSGPSKLIIWDKKASNIMM